MVETEKIPGTCRLILDCNDHSHGHLGQLLPPVINFIHWLDELQNYVIIYIDRSAIDSWNLYFSEETNL